MVQVHRSVPTAAAGGLAGNECHLLVVGPPPPCCASENFEDFVAKTFMMHLLLKSQKYEMSFVIQKCKK